ncbi:MAG TPA: type II toxin-antitoxin system RelE/ParE family toxin [Thermoanaerobaculia bacterium]|nr:type II toxin-antitoxin system RelE/ParE family toxin [Thermoanaerobaculia bacterium]
MASSDYRLELTALALANWVQLPTQTGRSAVDSALRRIARDPRGRGALAEAGRDEYRCRTEGILIRYAVDDQRRLVTVLRIRPI